MLSTPESMHTLVVVLFDSRIMCHVAPAHITRPAVKHAQIKVHCCCEWATDYNCAKFLNLWMKFPKISYKLHKGYDSEWEQYLYFNIWQNFQKYGGFPTPPLMAKNLKIALE